MKRSVPQPPEIGRCLVSLGAFAYNTSLCQSLRSSFSPDRDAFETAARTRRDLPTMIKASGTILPSHTAPLAFEMYRGLSDAALEERIAGVKARLGDSLLILGHHYQQDQVIRFADLRGDSLKLSQLAAQSNTCRAIVFCGVHFMAETADILSRDEVEVYLPDLSAGC